MKNQILFILAAVLMISEICFAQSQDKVIEDFKPTAANQPGKEYPQVNSEGRVRVKIKAPEANYVQIDIGAVKYDLTKDEEGISRIVRRGKRVSAHRRRQTRPGDRPV